MIMKKQINILITFFFLVSVPAGAQWHNEKSPTGKRLNSISTGDSSVAWIVGDKGTMLYGNGSSWRLYNSPTAKNLYSVEMKGSEEGWAVGEDGAILHYNGKDWENIGSPTKKDLYSVSFSGNDSGIAVGENGIIISFNGKTWEIAGKKTRGNLFSSYYSKDDIWIAGGRECVNVPIIKLQAGGKGTVNSVKTLATISGLEFISPDNGWAVGSPSVIMHFDGEKWTKSDLGFKYPSLRAVFFADKGSGISVGYGGTILSYHIDQWKKENSGTSLNLNGVTMFQNTFYAVGDSGIILSKNVTTDEKTEYISENVNNNLEIYPNPCDDFLNVTIPGGIKYARCYLSVKNRTGQTLFQNEFVVADVNILYRLSTHKYSNGFYILELVSGEKRYSAKFIVQH